MGERRGERLLSYNEFDGRPTPRRRLPQYSGSIDTPGRQADKEFAMNWDRIEGNWTQLKGKVREQWGKLTDDDIDVVAGKREQLSGKIQERYGIAKDEADKQLDQWQTRADDRWLS